MRMVVRSLIPLLLPLVAGAQDPPAPTSGPGPVLAPDLIDRHIQAEWKRSSIAPAKPCDDAEFLRRVHLDLAGIIPPYDVTVRFLADRSANRREKLVDELIAGDRFPEYWAELWDALLIGYDLGTKFDSNDTLMTWLRDEVFAKNLPYDEMVRQLLSAKGRTREDGRTVFLWRIMRRGGRAEDMATRVSRLFLGTQVQCAQCHDHPWDRWTQEDFYGVAAFFARVRSKKVRPDDQRDQEFEIWEDRRGEAAFGEGRARKPVPPRTLDGLAPAKNEERRAAFARLVARPENPLFAKAAVNRMWFHFFGRGLIHPVEEINDRNRPSHPELLDDLARAFADSRFDMRRLMKSIVLSKTYQLSSRRPSSKDRAPEKHFSYAIVRPLSPEELLNSLIEATGSEERLRMAARRAGGNMNIVNFKREMLRAFRFAFGDEEDIEKTDFEGTIPQALSMMNSDTIHRGIVERDQRLDLILRTRTDPGERLETIFLTILSRRPIPSEAARYLRHIQEKKNDRRAYEDLFWTLLNSSEFMFSH